MHRSRSAAWKIRSTRNAMILALLVGNWSAVAALLGIPAATHQALYSSLEGRPEQASGPLERRVAASDNANQ